MARDYVLADGALTVLVEEPRFPDHAREAVAGGLVAPMPGKVVKVLVTAGQEVAAGRRARRARGHEDGAHRARGRWPAPSRALHVAVGDQVDADRLLAVVTT